MSIGVSSEMETSMPGSEGEEPTHRDLQRKALRDLVELATQCAAEESEIDRRRQTELETAKRQFDKQAGGIVSRHEAEKIELAQRLQAATEAVEVKLQTDTAKLRSAEENYRAKVEANHDPIVRKVKEKLDHDLWMADSVYEVSQNQVRADLKMANDDNDKFLETLSEFEGQAKRLMEKYRVSAPLVELPPFQPPADVEAAFNAAPMELQSHLSSLRGLMVAILFSGGVPFLALGVLTVLGGVAGWFYDEVQGAVYAAGGAFIVAIALGGLLYGVARKAAHRQYRAFAQSHATSKRLAALRLEQITEAQEKKLKEAGDRRKAEMARAKEKVAPVLANAQKQRAADLTNIDNQVQSKLSRIAALTEKARNETNLAILQEQETLQQRHRNELKEHREKYDQSVAQSEKQRADARAALENKWSDGLKRIAEPIGAAGGLGAFPSWEDPVWKQWVPPATFPPAVRFGALHVDVKKIIEGMPREGNFTLPIPDSFVLPGVLSFPQQASLLIEAAKGGRDEAVRVLQMLMVRLLTSVPPGRVHFTIIDPVGLGRNFAGFMHLADYDEALVGTRIWTDTDQIEQRLTDLTEHMETVIQKYLRNEFETIDEYNKQAGELAEPYRYLVIADFPVRFEGEAYRRLNSIANSGARCGVYTLILRDTRVPLPVGTHLDDVEKHSVVLEQDGEPKGDEPARFVWKDEIFRQFPLDIDPPPSEEFLTRILQDVGKRAKEAKRVELAFETIAPKAEEFWTLSTREEVRVPIGRSGATRLQMLRLGRGVAQHALIAGKTGSGKSTLLHAMITNLAMWYNPDEVEFYLIDFKKGVEFKTYANYSLPHARVIAVESDREFGISVLQRLDAELARRGNIYRKAGVQDLNSYRQTPGAEVMPRTLLIIDEFQELFTEDDKLAQDAQLLIERLVRQGRAFGMHVLLGSQTIGGAGGLSRSTLGQMGVRIALALSEADSQLILGDNNSAARSLSRPGEAIYNDAGGLVENNSPFQIAFLTDEKKDRYLAKVHSMAVARGDGRGEPLVFEGNAPADITRNRMMESLIAAPNWTEAKGPLVAWLGDPVAIKDPTALAFRRQSGSNAIMVGQADEGAMALMAASVASVALQLPPSGVSFVVLDGTAADSPLSRVFPALKQALPYEMKLVEYRLAGDAMTELGAEFKRRSDEGLTSAPAIFVIVNGLQRYRVLRKTEDSSFSFSAPDEAKPVAPDKIFADLVRDGPTYGMHVMIWVDTPVSIDRTFERGILREFDYRILFQMSANDSGVLIDSPAGNKLGPYRALAYSEEQGTIEKFRPYALPTKPWLDRLKETMAKRQPA